MKGCVAHRITTSSRYPRTSEHADFADEIKGVAMKTGNPPRLPVWTQFNHAGLKSSRGRKKMELGKEWKCGEKAGDSSVRITLPRHVSPWGWRRKP